MKQVFLYKNKGRPFVRYKEKGRVIERYVDECFERKLLNFFGFRLTQMYYFVGKRKKIIGFFLKIPKY